MSNRSRAGGMFFLRPMAADVEVLNDVNGELINLYRVVKHHLEEFVRQFKRALSSRQVFKWLQITPEETLTDIQRAARFFYLQHSAFGGRVDGQSYGTATTAPPGLNLLRIEENLSAAHLRLASAYVENLPWLECIRRYDRPHTFFSWIHRIGRPRATGRLRLGTVRATRARVGKAEGKAIVTLNDHPAIRDLFASFPIESTDITYTVGGGAGAQRRELVIFSWDVHAEPAGLV